MSQHVPTEPVYLPHVTKRYPATKKLGVSSHAILHVLNEGPDKRITANGKALKTNLSELIEAKFDIKISPKEMRGPIASTLRVGLIKLDENSMQLTTAGARAASDMVKYGSNAFVVYYHVHRLGQVRASEDKTLYQTLSEITGLSTDHVARGMKQCVRSGLLKATRSKGATSALVSVMVDTSPTVKTQKKTAKNDEPRYAPSQAFMLNSEKTKNADRFSLESYKNDLVDLFERAIMDVSNQVDAEVPDYSATLKSILVTIKKVNDGKTTTMSALNHIETITRTALKESHDVGAKQALPAQVL